ncbi:MAG: hypothetical protein ABEJ31_09260 [Haloarculaceae archaeon]
MTKKQVFAAGVMALLLLFAGCTSGGGGGGGSPQANSSGGGGNQTGGAGAIIETDVVAGHHGVPENDSLVKPCLPLGTYARGMQPAWHVTVIDPSTGEKLTNKTVDSVTVKTDSGQTVPAEYHPSEKQWHGCFILPDDAKTGTMGYTVIVEKGGKTYKSSGTINVVESLNASAGGAA